MIPDKTTTPPASPAPADQEPLDAAASNHPTTPPAPADQAPATASTQVTARQSAPIMPNSPAGLTLSAAVRVAAAHLQAGNPAGMLAAALKDIVPASDTGEGIIRPQFIDELWTASLTQRPLIDSITRAPLSGLKVYGWKFDETPQVDLYAGNKAEIPSNDVTTVPAEATAQRFAGGWDIDRAYVDLGAAGFLDTVFRKAVDDYMAKTETYATTKLVAGATAVAASDSFTAALAGLGATAAGLGANLSFVNMGLGAWSQFVNLTDSEVPWWLRSQGTLNLGTVDGQAGGIRFNVNPALASTEILAGDKRAATWYEVTPPIRVQALDLPHGGIDLGVFGYGALLVHDKRALIKTTVNPTPAPPAG